MGNSILQPPIFKRYKMVEEPLENYQVQGQNVPVPKTDYLTKSDFEPYKAIIDEMQKIVKELNGSGESS